MKLYLIMASTMVATLAIASEYRTGENSTPAPSQPTSGVKLKSDETSTAWIDRNDGTSWLAAGAMAKIGGSVAENVVVKTANSRLVFTPVQRNGTSLSNSRNGYYEDVNRSVSPYVIDGGIRSLRIPIKRSIIWQNGEIQDSVTLNGYKTNQWLALKPIIDFATQKDVAVVIDDHTYSPYGNPEVLAFWIALGNKLKATYGDNDLIHLELQNETSGGGWEVGYGPNLKKVIQGIRAAGITYPLIVGWGNWNAVGSYSKALVELDAVGGPANLDPLGKTEFSVHHYPTTSGNDMAVSGKSAPEIYGAGVASGFPTMFDEFKRRGLHIWVTEIGMGGGARVWLSNGSGAPSFNGKVWLESFTTLVKQYPDTVSGVLAWGGGSAWGDSYPFKQEYTKDNWAATEKTDFWLTISKLWKK